MNTVDLGQRLQDETTGCKLEVTAFSTRKKMTDTQRKRMAEFFNADIRSVSGGREILNKKIPEVRMVYSIIREARGLWSNFTVKYEDGVRLIRADRIEWMNGKIGELQEELRVAKQALFDAWEVVKQDAENRLADLYVAGDYSFDVRQVLWINVSYPAIGPDPKLKQLSKELFEAELAKFRVRFEEAARDAEQALQVEFAAMITGIAERLEEGESEDGKKRVLQQRAVDNVVEFANRFRALSVGGSGMDALVEQAEQLALGLDTKAMKKDASTRATIRESFGALQAAIEKQITVAAERTFELE